MADAFHREAQAGEKLATLHTAMARCSAAWTALAKTGEPVTLTPAQAMELADFFAKAGGMAASAAILLGFALVPVPPQPEPAQTPAPAKPRLAVIEGGKAQ